MKRSHVFAGIGAVLLILPTFAFAQTPLGTNVRDLNGFFRLVSSILNTLIGLAITLGILAFIWGLVRYIYAGGEDKAAGLQTMLWGTIAIFFMVSIWGIVRIFQNTLGVGGQGAIQAPTGPATNAGGTVYNQPPQGTNGYGF